MTMTMTSDSKKKFVPLADELRSTIERTELLHAQLLERDKPKGGAVQVGSRWSEVLINGAGYGGEQSTARATAKGILTSCASELGGCRGRGYLGENGHRSVCSVCGGTGRIVTAAGLDFLRAIALALSPQVKQDATTDALELHNMAVAENERQREEAKARQTERARQERAVLGEAAAKLAALRGTDPTFETADLEIARKNFAPAEAK
jgi:hypothetical protein